MARIVALKKDRQSPANERPIDPLMARRAELIAEAAKLRKVADARAAVEAKLAALDTQQADIDAKERSAWNAWAATADGPPPTPLTREREDVAKARALLAGDLSSALNGEQAVAPRLQALNAEWRDLNAKIFEQRVAALLTEADEVNADVHAAAKAFLAACERQDGLRDALIEAQARAVNGADAQREAVLRGAFSHIAALKPPKLAGDAATRARHAADFRRRLT